MTISLGTLIGLPILLLLTLAAAVTAWLLWRYRRYLVAEGDHMEQIDIPMVTTASIGAGVVAAGLLIGTAVGMWPYSGEYHTWRDTTGTVKTIDSRLNGAGGTQRFVVTYTDGRQRACDDTRCATVKPGDRLTLKCKRAYQWGATPGYDCNWVGNETSSR